MLAEQLWRLNWIPRQWRAENAPRLQLADKVISHYQRIEQRAKAINKAIGEAFNFGARRAAMRRIRPSQRSKWTSFDIISESLKILPQQSFKKVKQKRLIG